VKDAWIAAHRNGFALKELCDVLEVSVGGYRAWQGGGTPDRRGLTDAQLPALIRSIHAELKGAYGSPRMVHELRARGFSASTARVERPDAQARHPGAPQAPRHGHDRLQAQPAGGR
jgi:putative transposase